MGQVSIAFLAFCVLGACRGHGVNYEPILDGSPSATYRDDVSACRALAASQKRINQEAVASAALGAGVGAILGATDGGETLGGAATGALVGGVAGSVEAEEQRKAIVLECLRGRGHAVVG